MKGIKPGSDPKLSALIDERDRAHTAVCSGGLRNLTRNAKRLDAACVALDAYITARQ